MKYALPLAVACVLLCVASARSSSDPTQKTTVRVQSVHSQQLPHDSINRVQRRSQDSLPRKLNVRRQLTSTEPTSVAPEDQDTFSIASIQETNSVSQQTPHGQMPIITPGQPSYDPFGGIIVWKRDPATGRLVPDNWEEPLASTDGGWGDSSFGAIAGPAASLFTPQQTQQPADATPANTATPATTTPDASASITGDNMVQQPSPSEPQPTTETDSASTTEPTEVVLSAPIANADQQPANAQPSQPAAPQATTAAQSTVDDSKVNAQAPSDAAAAATPAKKMDGDYAVEDNTEVSAEQHSNTAAAAQPASQPEPTAAATQPASQPEPTAAATTPATPTEPAAQSEPAATPLTQAAEQPTAPVTIPAVIQTPEPASTLVAEDQPAAATAAEPAPAADDVIMVPTSRISPEAPADVVVPTQQSVSVSGFTATGAAKRRGAANAAALLTKPATNPGTPRRAARPVSPSATESPATMCGEEQWFACELPGLCTARQGCECTAELGTPQRSNSTCRCNAAKGFKMVTENDITACAWDVTFGDTKYYEVPRVGTVDFPINLGSNMVAPDHPNKVISNVDLTAAKPVTCPREANFIRLANRRSAAWGTEVFAPGTGGHYVLRTTLRGTDRGECRSVKVTTTDMRTQYVVFKYY